MMKISKLFDKVFLKFVFVGVINTCFGTLVMFCFYNFLHLSYWISSAANYIFGSILSYFLNKYFTFNYKSKDASVVIKFIINITVCYLVAYGIAKPLIYNLFNSFDTSIKDNISMLTGMGLFVILNYMGQRFWAFKSKD